MANIRGAFEGIAKRFWPLTQPFPKPLSGQHARISKTSNFSSNFVSTATFIRCTVTGTVTRVLLFYRSNTKTIHALRSTEWILSRILQQRSWSRRRNTWRIKRKRRENTRRRERDCKENVVEGVLNATVISDWSLDTYSTFRAGYTVRVSVLRVHFQFTKEFDGVWLQKGKREIMEGIKRRWKGRWKAEVSR